MPSSFVDQPAAGSGTIDCMLFWGTFWSQTTRLLKTPIIGRTAAAVDSSSNDILAGQCCVTGTGHHAELPPTVAARH